MPVGLPQQKIHHTFNPEPHQISTPLSSLFVAAMADSAGGRASFHHGRRPSQRSRSAIIVAGQDEVEHVFVLKAWAAHATTDELIDEIFFTQEQWHPSIFGVDATGPQLLFVDSLRREAREKGKRLPLTEMVFTEDKDFRIETTLQPLAHGGKLFCSPAMDKLQHEYESFPGAPQKDLLDALSACCTLFPKRAKVAEARDEMRQYREYLRATGLSGEAIARRVQAEMELRESARERDLAGRR